MELSLDNGDAEYRITGYKPGSIFINKVEYRHSLLLMPNKLLTDQAPNSVDDLDPEFFRDVAAMKPQVTLLGTGRQLKFPDPAIFAPLYEHQIGIEVMDTAAACRTYAVLVAEGRNVAAILLIDNNTEIDQFE